MSFALCPIDGTSDADLQRLIPGWRLSLACKAAGDSGSERLAPADWESAELAKPDASSAALLVAGPVLAMFAPDALALRAVVTIVIDLTRIGRLVRRVRVVSGDPSSRLDAPVRRSVDRALDD